MTNVLVCWKCGIALTDQPLPLSRLAVCTKCRVYLHSCRLCLFYDPRLTRKCREQDAEEVSDTERANFCAYFKVKLGDLRPGGESRTQTTRARLGELFGADEKSDEKPES